MTMKQFLSICFLFIFPAFTVVAQDDEARRQSGLPTMIGGGNSANNGGVLITGRLDISGVEKLNSVPTFIISVYVGGRLLDQREVKYKGSFQFAGITYGSDAYILVEADNKEIRRIPILVSDVSGLNPQIRQDINITWTEIQNAKINDNKVINANSYYKRSEENQKLFDKAIVSAKNKKTDEAISGFKKIVEKDEKDFVSWTELGTAYFVDKKMSEAESAYKKAIEIKPEFAPALLNSGKLYLAEKAPEKAVEVLIKAVELEPTSADINQFLGESYLQIKKGSKAVIYLNEAIKLAPIEKAEIHLRLATLYNGANLKDKAVNEYKMFLEKVPNFPEKDRLEKYIKENSPK
jgi:tetratricopeptide (TPR) repeat protein